MQAKILILAASIAFSASAQTTFTLRNATAGDSPRQIWSILAGSDGLSPTIDPATASITVKGTPTGLALAQYLIGALDVTPASAATKAAFSYTSATGTPAMLRAIHLTNPSTGRSLMSVGQCLRSLDGQSLGNVAVDSTGMVILRGSKNDVALGEWILQALDRSSNAATPTEFAIPASGNIVRAFYPASMTADYQISTTAKLLSDSLRSTQACQASSPATIIVRGTSDQIKMAGEYIQQQDENVAQHPAPTGLRPGFSQSVFTLINAASGNSPQEISMIMNRVLLNATLNPAVPSLTVQGTADELSAARYIVDALDVTPAAAVTKPELSWISWNNKPHVTRAIHLENARAQRSMLDIVTYLRLFDGIGVGTISANSMAIVSGTRSDVALGGWILQVLDRGSDTGAPTEFVIPGDVVEGGNIVHAFYPASITSIQPLAQISRSMRDTLGIKHVWQSVSPSTIIVQGTADQIEKARELIQQQTAASIAQR